MNVENAIRVKGHWHRFGSEAWGAREGEGFLYVFYTDHKKINNMLRKTYMITQPEICSFYCCAFKRWEK